MLSFLSEKVLGNSKKDIIQDYIQKLYYLNTDDEKLKKLEDIDTNILSGYIKVFLHRTGEYLIWNKKERKYIDKSNYMSFGYWFNGLSEAYQIAVFNATIIDHISRWYRVLYHGTLVGKMSVKINRFIEDRGALQEIKNYASTIAEGERLARLEEEKKEKERLKREKERSIKKKVQEYQAGLFKEIDLYKLVSNKQTEARIKIKEQVKTFERELRFA